MISGDWVLLAGVVGFVLLWLALPRLGLRT
jgi:hypothetical protein